MKREVTAKELEQPLIAYRDAVDAVLGEFSPLPAVNTALDAALGLVLAEDVVSSLDVPGFDNSAMDGYAVRAADTPGVLRLIGDIPAGSHGHVTVEPGTAATIMTGAPLPDGADAVVPWEDTDARDGTARDGAARARDTVDVRVRVEARRHVRPRGEDVRAGARVVSSGTLLKPIHIGVLASIGCTSVRTHPRPRVAILSTGDEVVAPGGVLNAGTVYDANRSLLRAMCAKAGADIIDDALISDDPDALAEWLHAAAARADLIVTSGGVSVGEHDWLRAILEKDGELRLWRVAIKPGKPIAFGSIDGTPVLALPGNPGSVFVGAHVFVCPVIRAMCARDPAPQSVRAVLAAAVPGSPSRTMFCRVRLDGERAIPLPAQSSVVLSNLIPADGFAIVGPGGLPEGALVTVEVL